MASLAYARRSTDLQTSITGLGLQMLGRLQKRNYLKYMINPRINIGNRALAFVGFAIVFILVKIIGDRFGSKGVSIFLSIIFGSLAIFIIYWLIRILIIFINTYKETKNNSGGDKK